ncbi:MAG TPA: DoxX family membrane protein [Pseudonocardiaceae bacterium]|nr:DoxX family membrane protein [Pseudonocardiaceae bacterium]
MSTHEDRPTSAGGHPDSDFFFTPSQSRGGAGGTYDAQGHDPDFDFDESAFDDPSFGGTEPPGTGPTRALPTKSTGRDEFGYDAGDSEYPGLGGGYAGGGGYDDYDDDQPRPNWHGGADFGLLVLRLVVGGTAVGHGLQDLFGLWHGIGRVGLERFLLASGYQHTGILAWLTGGAELGGGALLILGMFTQLGAAALLALLVNVIVLKWKLGFFTPGYEYELVAASATFALLFTGPGRISLDRPTPWYRHPVANGVVLMIIAGLGAGGVLFFLHTR